MLTRVPLRQLPLHLRTPDDVLHSYSCCRHLKQIRMVRCTCLSKILYRNLSDCKSGCTKTVGCLFRYPLYHSSAMIEPILIAPSILSANFAHLGDAVREAEVSGADAIHVDVMDGHFVPNITMGPVVVKALRPITKLPLIVHLMIENPDRYLEVFADAGADTLIVHPEASVHLHRTLQKIRGLSVGAGVALNPATPEILLRYVLPLLDEVLVMTVNPGFGGQAFLREMLPKIRVVRRMLDSVGSSAHVAVDGGIDPETAPLVVEEGANVLVAGSAIYGASAGVAAAITALRSAL